MGTGKRYLLLGGTGAMGHYLCDELLSRGAEVHVTSRHARASSGRLHYVHGDAHDTAFLQGVMRAVRPDVVVDFMVYGTREFEARYRDLLAGCGHYVFLSSYRVFADSRPLVESSPRLLDVCTDAAYLQTDEYGLSKARQENLLRASGVRNWTIVRPSITYSKSRFQFGCLEAGLLVFRALQGVPVAMPAEMLDKQATLTWAKDVARLIAGLAGNPAAMGEDFNVVTSESHTWREIAEIYRRAIGLEVREVSLAEYLTVCAKYQTVYDRMFDRAMDNTKVLRATGLSQADLTPLETGLTAELEDFKRHPDYQYGVDWGGNAALDRICGTRISLAGATARQKLVYWRCRYHWVGALGNMAAALLGRRA